MICKNVFKFQKRNGETLPAIWLRLYGKYVKVFPLALYDALWRDYESLFFSPNIESTFYTFDKMVSGYFRDKTREDYHIDFQRKMFTESAIRSLTELCNAALAGLQTAYNDFNSQTAKQMLIGLNKVATHGIHSGSHATESMIEPFSFDFVEPYSCDTGFSIQIGDRQYSSALSDWTTDFNQIRLEMEMAIRWQQDNADIRLHFEDSPTIIRLQHYNLHNSSETVVRTTIIPDTFHYEPRIYGLCSERQLISALYLGLLKIAVTDVDDTFDTCFGEWSDIRLNIYNELQSCVIEKYIKRTEEDVFHFRNRVINTVDEMKADYQRLQKELKL